MKSVGKKRICDALCALADNRPVEEITISQLIAYAGVNRSTFYYHFPSVQAVLEFMMDDFCACYLATLMMPLGETVQELHSEKQMALEQNVCQYVKETGQYVLFFLQEQNYQLFCHKFKQHCLEYCQAHTIVQTFPDGHTEPLRRGVVYDYYVHITCLQLFAILECWAGRGFSEQEEDFVHLFDMLRSTTITLRGR